MGDENGPSDPRWHTLHLWQIAAVRDLLWIVFGLFLLWFGYYLRGIFTPVLIALVVAYLFQPVIDTCQHRYRVPRALTTTAILMVLLVAGGGFAAWAGPRVIAQLVDLAKDLPGYLQALADRYDVDTSEMQERVTKWGQRLQSDPGGFLLDYATALFTGTSQTLSVLGQVLGTVGYWSMTLVLLPIYFFFFAWRFDAIAAYVTQYIPASGKERTMQVLGRMDEAISTFFRDRVIIAVIMIGLFALGWSPLVAEVPYWLLLAVLTGVLSLIPYAPALGWIAALSLKTLQLISMGALGPWEWVLGLGTLTLVYGVVQILEGWLLTPWIQGQSLNMSSVTILIVLLIGGAVGGMYGLILCVPLAACIKIFFQEVVAHRLQRWAKAH